MKRAHVVIVAMAIVIGVGMLLTERVKAASFTVDNLNDSGAGSLRQAIINANAAGGANLITFNVTGTINLLSALPSLSGSLSISGPGANLLTISRDSSVGTLRLFQVTSSGTVTISGVTLANGNAIGGAAISKFNGGTLNIENCVISNNAGGVGGGGALLNNGNNTINITNCTITGNSANGGEGGAIRHSGAGTININGSTFSGNSATNLACLHNNSSGAINVTNTAIMNNSAQFDAGAISNSAGTVTVIGCTISNNIAGNVGGAIKNQTTGTVTVIESTISGNRSSGVGGGIYNNTGTINVIRSTMTGNFINGAGGSGGAIHNNGTGTIRVTNSTLSANRAGSSGGGGGLSFGNSGGAGQGVIVSSTITGNSAASGGGINVVNGVSVTIRSTIIAGNTANNASKDISGPLNSAGYNLIGNNNGGAITPATGDQIGTSPAPINPLLGPLQNNGGPTFTHALLPGSPALNQGDDCITQSPGCLAAPLDTDQRGAGFPRLDGAHVDTGACESLSPTAIKLVSFRATAYAGGQVLLEWQTGFEVDNLGFNIYRQEARGLTRVNPQLIDGSALMAGPATLLRAGFTYSWWAESSSEPLAPFWLEDLDLTGNSSLHGPFYLKQVAGQPPAHTRAALLNHQAKPAPIIRNITSTASPTARASSQNLAAQWQIAASPAVKIEVRKDGWHRLTQPQLVAAGLNTAGNTSLLQVFADGSQVPIKVSDGGDGSLDPQDFIEFYGLALDTPSTDARIYWLVVGTDPGQRIGLLDTGGGAAALAPNFSATVERKDRTIYFAALKNGEADNFFGPVVNSTELNQTIPLRNLDPGATEGALLEVALQGMTDLPASPDHSVNVKFNGALVGSMSFDGQARHVQTFPVAANLLEEGDNTITLVATGGQNETSLADYLRVTYRHRYTADDDRLVFKTSTSEQYSVTGFTSAGVRVYDITNASAPVELTASVEEQKAGFAVKVRPADAAERTLLAIADGQADVASSVVANVPSRWNVKEQGADIVMIAHQGLASSINPLKAFRQSRGFAVSVIDVEDLYDEFSYGAHSPQAVKDFLARANSEWKKRPRYVLLVGDASLDPRNYLGFGDLDQVPTKIVETALLETASDDWLADFNADAVSDLAIGRLPARTPQQATVMVDKILRYEQARVEGMLLVADRNDGYDFDSAQTELLALVPPGVIVREVRRSQTDDQAAREKVLAELVRGPGVVNYMGHASLGQWNGSMLEAGDAASLAYSEGASVYVLMTCLNGMFQHPTIESLAEALLKVEQGGAVGVWGSTGLCRPNSQAVLNQEMYRQMCGGGTAVRLGDAARAAKMAVTDMDVRRTWVLLGDPTMRLK